MENNKEKQVKLLAVQGILAILKEAKHTPTSMQPIEAVYLMSKTIEAFESEIQADNEIEELELLLRELLDEVL